MRAALLERERPFSLVPNEIRFENDFSALAQWS